MFPNAYDMWPCTRQATTYRHTLKVHVVLHDAYGDGKYAMPTHSVISVIRSLCEFDRIIA